MAEADDKSDMMVHYLAVRKDLQEQLARTQDDIKDLMEQAENAKAHARFLRSSLDFFNEIIHDLEEPSAIRLAVARGAVAEGGPDGMSILDGIDTVLRASPNPLSAEEVFQRLLMNPSMLRRIPRSKASISSMLGAYQDKFSWEKVGEGADTRWRKTSQKIVRAKLKE